MENFFSESSIIKEIINQLPNATDIFKKYDINFCCGGNRELGIALSEGNLPSDEVLKKLNDLYHHSKALKEATIDHKKATTKEIIEHIKYKYHSYLTEELDQLSPYLTKMLKAHGAKNPSFYTLHKLFHILKIELQQLIIRNETINFSLLASSADSINEKDCYTALQDSSTYFTKTQVQVQELLKEIRLVTNDYKPAKDACATQRVVHKRLKDLESEILALFAIEESFLFAPIN